MRLRPLLAAQAPAEDEIASRFGGRPLVAADRAARWPHCRCCEGAMQFLGQLVVDGNRLVSLFMCQNDPGCCDEWDPGAGGNAAFVFETGGALELLEPPADGETALEGTWGASLSDAEVAEADVPEFGSAYDVARERATDRRQVLGMLGGQPAWIQADETPSCDACAQPMRFVAQLEEGPDYRAAMNFGSGSAYVFRCDCDAAKLLWQQ